MFGSNGDYNSLSNNLKLSLQLLQNINAEPKVRQHFTENKLLECRAVPERLCCLHFVETDVKSGENIIKWFFFFFFKKNLLFQSRFL